MSTQKIELRAEGRLWGTLQVNDGRLLLDCKKGGQSVQFDLLATVESRKPVTNTLVFISHSDIDMVDSSP